MMRIDLSGRKFGRLAVLKIHGHKGKRLTYECLCDCGKTHVAVGENLRDGTTKSCGCYRREITSPFRNGRHIGFKHGFAGRSTQHPLYNIWAGIMDRCHNQSARDYYLYGGRGISVCERWKHIENFIADMGDRHYGRSIDRINNDGNYEPRNCRWATIKQQSNNRRTNHILKFKGKSQTMQAWSEEIGVNKNTLYGRTRKGWSMKKILSPFVRRYICGKYYAVANS